LSAAATIAPASIPRALPPEEAARGQFHALVARLLHAAPDAPLLSALAASQPLPEGSDAALANAWRDLVDASSAMDADAAAEEYETLFVGVGKAVVSLYAGYYNGAPSIDHPRVRIQADLAALGLARRERVAEPEDHYAGLFDVMRVLVAGGAGRSPASVSEQRRFWETHLAPGLDKFVRGLAAAEQANYYRRVAAFLAAFAALESESFLLD
jgi:TorA maturation chaperone TorD